jgi:hypothetical protein
MYESIQYVYEVFAKYPKPGGFPTCDRGCCVSHKESLLLLNRNLLELTADELRNYAGDVFLTVGSLADFKYFLPRILDLSVTEKFSWWPTPEVVLGKLPLAGWDHWLEIERKVVMDLLNERFAALIQDANSDGSDIDTWVCALGRCVPDVTPYLEPLLEEANQGKLLSFIEWNPSAFSEAKLANGFWKDAIDNQQRVLAWLNQDRVKRLLSEKYGMLF